MSSIENCKSACKKITSDKKIDRGYGYYMNRLDYFVFVDTQTQMS